MLALAGVTGLLRRWLYHDVVVAPLARDAREAMLEKPRAADDKAGMQPMTVSEARDVLGVMQRQVGKK